MSGIKHLKWLPAAWLLLAATVHGETSSRLSSRFLARGEQALLEIAVSNAQPSAFPQIPRVEGVTIQLASREPRPQQLPGRRLEYVFEYLVSSYKTGTHILPAIEVMTSGARDVTEPIEFTVFNPDELKWSDAVAGGTRFRYASAFRIMNPRPYEGEATPVEIKIYVPSDLFVDDWGIPDFQRDGVTSWRFQPSKFRGPINLLGLPYSSVAYPSTLTPTRGGKVGIGPATVRLVTRENVMDGFLRTVYREVHLAIPKLEVETNPLPANAPEGFENAVGDFKISVKTELTEAQEGDPIPVDITVTGSGNLDTLRPPKPVNSDGWKLYEATAEQRGDERRELSGTLVFHQFMRPLELKSAVPAFRLVYFDPREQIYKTLTTEPIPLKMKPSMAAKPAAATPPPALATPVERMTDILAPLEPASLTISESSRTSGWLGHLIGVLLALVLIAKALWMRFGHRFRKDPLREMRGKALREVESAGKGSDIEFLMSAGRFIEQCFGNNPPPEVREVLSERDAVCFKMEKPAGTVLTPKRRESILRILRKAAAICIAACLAGTSGARAEDIASKARTAYEAARYDEAIGLWLKAGDYDDLSADTLYNIGNACYRAGSAGHAALYYRRALVRDPGHLESRQNLRFIERKYGSITVHRPDFQYALARFPLDTWKNVLWAGLWLCGLAALVFPATRPDARIRLAAVAAWVIGPMLAACGALGWYYFPNDAEFAPLARQAVIVGEKNVLHADASRTSPEVIDAPPGSLCEVIRESGRWAYVSFATKTRGWIPIESVEKIMPSSPPVPPTIRKPKADGKSA